MSLKETLAEVDPRTVLIFEAVKPNLSTNLKKSSVLKIAYHTYNNSCISRDRKRTKISKIWSVKKILFIIGLLKKYLGSTNSFYDKVNLENKMIRVVIKLDEIVREHNLDLSNLKEELSINTIEYLRLINNISEKSFIGGKTGSLLISGLIKKFESINLFESNKEIKDLEALDIYITSLFLNKVFVDYVKIIDSVADKELFTKNFQSLEKINIFIKYLQSKDDNIKTFIQSSDETKKLIIKIKTENFIDALLN
jgi:hypothetical protein